MLNKCASIGSGQGSNDEQKHMIQVNERNLIYSNNKKCHAWNILKQTRKITLFWPFVRFICVWVTLGLWPISTRGTFSHDCLRFKFLRFFFFQIYTEWANYYLERHKSKRKVVNLSVDARDGLLLAEIIEAVVGFEVPNLIKKPKNHQMVSHSQAINQTRILQLSNEWSFVLSRREDINDCDVKDQSRGRKWENVDCREGKFAKYLESI